MTPGPSQEVTAALAAHGRVVSSQVIEDEVQGLAGLSDDEARDVLLASYGLTETGPTSSFVPDRSGRQSVLALLAQGRGALVYVLVAAMAGIIPAIAVPLLLRLFVDRYLVAGDPGWAMPVLLGLLGAALVSAGAVALQYAVLRRLVTKLSKTGQLGFTWHVLTMRVPDVDTFGPGDLVARINTRQRLSYQGGLLLPLAGVNVLNTIVFAIALLALDVPLGLTALAVAAASIAASLVVLHWRSSRQRESDDALVELTSVTADLVGSIESIKAAAWEQFAFARWATYRRAMAHSLTRLGVATQTVSLIPVITTALGLGAVLAVGCLLVMKGSITLGTVVAAQAFAVMLLEALAMLVWFGVLYQSVTSAAQQSDALLRTPLDPELIEVEAVDAHRPLRGAIALNDVTFGYDRDRPPLLEGISLQVPAGSRLALVGSSGSGKTTIARLVIGELRPWSGLVEIDDTPRLRLARESLNADVAYVPQTPVLFPGTLRDNLTMWDDRISDEQLHRAAADACIEDAVLARAGGFYATITGRDSGFSGGEMQRLAIARALVRDPAVLVLDEATSALDPVVEAEVEENLRRRGCTCLVVAHRLSTIRDADQILVVESGRIIQQGCYEDIRTKGFFAELIHG